MKQLLPLLLLLLPCLALAQYPTNGNQKITLGEQTTADGLIFRGVLADTGIITPSSDTSAYIILDTVNHRFYNYNLATNVWSVAGGGTAVTTFSGGTTGFTPNTATSGAVTLGGTLAVANGGTGSATQNFVDLTTNQSTIAGDKTLTGKLTSSNFQFNGIIRDNLSNSVIQQSANNVSNNRTFTFGNATYANYHVKFKQFIFTTAEEIPSTPYLFYVSGAGLGGGADGSDIYFKGITPTGGSTRAGSDFIIDLPDGFAGGRRGNVGIGVLSPTAALHLLAGTATASTAPLKFNSQGASLLNPVEPGAVEFNGTNLLFTPSATRHTVNHGLTGSATLNFPSTTTLLSADLTITVTGAADGDVVSLGVPNAAVNANTSYSAWVSAANTVTVRFNNYSSGTVDPASALFKVFVTK